MLGHEHVLRDDGVAAGAFHAGDEPGVLDRQLRHRHEREAEVHGLAGVVVHVDAARGPLRVHQPDAHIHLPVTRHPPSTAFASPCGASDPATHASGFAPQTSCCARSGNSAASHAQTLIRLATHDVEPQPRPSSAITSMYVWMLGLVAAEALRHHQPAEPGVAQRRDGRVRKPAKRIGEIRVLLEKRTQSRRSRA